MGAVGSAPSSAAGASLDQFIRQQFDVLQVLRDNIEPLLALAGRYTAVEDLEDFRDQIEALYPNLGLLVEASSIIIQTTDAGLALLVAEDAAAQRAALQLGSAALRDESYFATAAGLAAAVDHLTALDTAIAAIQQALLLKASQADLEALDGRVTDIEAEFTTQLGLLVSQLEGGTYFAGIDASINDLQTQITQHGDDIAVQAARVDDLTATLNGVGGIVDDAVATATDTLSTRVDAQDGAIEAIAADVTALEAELTTANEQIAAHGGAIDSLLTRVTATEDLTEVLSSSNEILTANITDLTEGLAGEAAARETLTARVSATENGMESLSNDVTQVTASLRGIGNELRNASFLYNLVDWTTLGNDGWTTLVRARMKGPVDGLPPGASALRLYNSAAGVTPAGAVIVGSALVPVDVGEYHMVSAWISAEHCTARLEYRLYNVDGDFVTGDIVGERSTVHPDTLSEWTRFYDRIGIPVGIAYLQVVLSADDCTAPQPKAWFAQPMVENVGIAQVTPSPWTGEGGLEDALASATESLEARVTTAEGAITATASDVTTLTTKVEDPVTGLDAQATAQAALTTTVTTHDGKITTLLAKYSMQLDVNGYLVGWEFNNDGTTGVVKFLSDKFSITKPAGLKSVEFADGVLMSVGPTKALYLGDQFGVGSKYVMWYGTKPGTGAPGATDAAAKMWLDKDGNAYFGGTLNVDEVLQFTGGNGVNYLWDEYCQFNKLLTLSPATTPAFFKNGGALTTVADATARGGYTLQQLTTSAANNIDWFYMGTNSTDYNFVLQGGYKYLFSFRAKANVVGHKVGVMVRTAAGDVWMDGSIVAAERALTNSMARYVGVIDLTLLASARNAIVLVYTNLSAVSGRTVNFDEFMCERMTGNLVASSTWVPGVPTNLVRAAQAAAANAQTAADTAAADAASSLTQLSDIASDAKLTANEKIIAKRNYEELVADYPGLLAKAIQNGLSAYMNQYATSYAALQTYLNSIGVVGGSPGYLWTSTTGTTNIVRATWDAKWKEAYYDRQTVFNALADTQAIGDDIVVNGGFESVVEPNLVSGYSRAVGDQICDGWFVETAVRSDCWNVISDTTAGRFRSGARSLAWGLGTGLSLAPNEQAYVVLTNAKKIQVKPGDRFRVRAAIWDAGGTMNASLRRQITVGLRCYDASGLAINSVGLNYNSTGNRTGGPGTGMAQQTAYATIPANTAFVRVQAYVLVQNTNGSVTMAVNAGAVVVAVDDLEIMRWGGGHELTETGSGKQIAGLINVPPAGFANLGSVWATGAITYTATGTPAAATINVSASTLRLGDDVISYNAMSVGVTGANGSTTTWLLYIDDPTWAGGSRTLVATTSYATAMTGNGRIYVGKISVTIPAAGGSGGGNPPRECIVEWADIPELVDDGNVLGTTTRKMGTVDRHQFIQGVNPVTEELYPAWVFSAQTRRAPCVLLVTENGVELPVSLGGDIRTPGGWMDAADMLGELMWTNVHGVFAYSKVIEVRDIGWQNVRHVVIEEDGNYETTGCFLAGSKPGYYGAHHNIKA